MPRKPTSPRYYASRGAYYVQLRGRQHQLAKGPEGGETLKAAERAYHTLMLQADATAGNPDATLFGLVAGWLTSIKERTSPKYHQTRRDLLQSLVDVHGTTQFRALTPEMVREWLAERSKFRRHGNTGRQTRWGPTTRKTALDALKMALRWAVDNGMIASHPVCRMKSETALSRGLACIIAPAQHVLLTERFRGRRHGDLADLLDVLQATGARPGEIAALTAAEWDAGIGAWVLRRGKKYKRSGRPRTIYLPAALRPMIEEHNRQRPTGPIFRTRRGDAYTSKGVKNYVFKARWSLNRVAEKAGNPPPFSVESPYGYRHYFATEWLRAGKPTALLCQLLDTSETMLRRHYSHLYAHTDALRAALEGFKPGG